MGPAIINQSYGTGAALYENPEPESGDLHVPRVHNAPNTPFFLLTLLIEHTSAQALFGG